MWGISAGLLVIGFVNIVILSAMRRSRGLREQTPSTALAPVEAGGESPASAFDRIATLLDEIEREREREATAEAEPKRRRRSAS
jgi:hypothetical protein